MSKQKRGLSKILKLSAVVVAIIVCIIAVLFFSLRPEKLEVSNVDLAAINNGSYTGSADNGMVSATVSVKVSDRAIQNIKIIKHDTLLGKPAEKIIDNIIKQQSLDVEVISSATYSSDTIRKAVENALRRGG